MTVAAGPDSINVIVQHKGRPGVMAGLFSCLFAFVAIFVFAIIFVPLALICGLVGLIAGVVGRGAAGIGLSLLGFLISAFAAIKSPAILLIFAALALASHHPRTSTSAAAAIDPPGHNTTDDLAPASPAASPAITVTDIDRATAWATDFDGRVTRAIATVPDYSAQYQQITDQMANYASRMARLGDDGQAGVQKSQLGVAMSQGQIALEQLHGQFEADKANITAALEDGRSRFNRIVAQCRTLAATSDNVGLACQANLKAAATLNDHLPTLNQALADTDAAYDRQQERQNQLMKSADSNP